MDDRIQYTSFVEQLTANQHLLYSYINTLLAGDANVRDVLQETNMELWRKADLYDPGRPFLAWAYRFAYYRVLEYRRSQRTSKVVFSDDLLSRVEQACQQFTTDTNDRLLALRVCLGELQPHQQDLVRLKYEERCSSTDISRRLGITEAQIGGRLYRLRRLLHQCVSRRVQAVI
ncbi:sigma-70 family RNA polymerase sigma factor [Aeoliella sp. SH292]|uniref:sigma-70 family RNA polymerase sigma factor n=1 Tax=Aeoliella sp. SH292 TaxID=3454464 RepID=UPI003F9C4FB5